jgi:DNA-binding transcriptional LysR family regulator
MSTQIQDLEAELGFKLFDRLPRGVKLSAAGKLFLEDARRILQQVNEAAQRGSRGARSIGDAADWIHREHLMARHGSGFIPAIPSGSA